MSADHALCTDPAHAIGGMACDHCTCGAIWPHAANDARLAVERTASRLLAERDALAAVAVDARNVLDLYDAWRIGDASELWPGMDPLRDTLAAYDRTVAKP